MSAGFVAHGERRGRAAARELTRARPRATPAAGAVLALSLLAAGLRFYGLGHQGFWFDEANTAQLVHLSPGKMLGLIPQSESTPPLYYGVAWVWARLFGFGEAGLRSLSAVAGVLVIPVAYATATRLISRRAGLIAAALTACNPLLIWYSQEARSYELLVLLSGLALLAFAHARESPSPRPLAAWVLASALALATHYYAIVAIIPQAAWLLMEHRRRRPVQIATAAVGLCGLALVPLALSQNATGHDGWIATAPLWPRLGQIVPQFLIGTGAPARIPLKYLAMAICVPALGLAAGGARNAEWRGARVAGGLALAGFLVGLALVAVGIDTLITRNLIALWLPAAILVSGGLARRRTRTFGVIAAGVLCAIGIAAAIGVAVDRNLQRPDWRAVAHVLAARPATGPGRAILVQHYKTLLPLSLYLPGLRVLGARGADVSELDVISVRSPQQRLCWWGAACNLIPSAMAPRYAVPGFHVLWRRRVAQFTVLRLVSGSPVHLTRAAVAAALTSTRLRRDTLVVQRR